MSSRTDRRIILGMVIYAALNFLSVAYLNSGLEKVCPPQVSSIPAFTPFVSMLSGPPGAYVIVVAANIVCICRDDVGPSALASCLVLVGSLVISVTDSIMLTPRIFNF